jgi:predicted RNase H-like HicB family nuclease
MLAQTKKIKEYTALFTPDEEAGGFVVEVPALPGCVTEGDTLAEAKKNAREAIELYLEVLLERGLSLPEDVEPNFFKGKIAIELSALAV